MEGLFLILHCFLYDVLEDEDFKVFELKKRKTPISIEPIGINNFFTKQFKSA